MPACQGSPVRMIWVIKSAEASTRSQDDVGNAISRMPSQDNVGNEISQDQHAK